MSQIIRGVAMQCVPAGNGRFRPGRTRPYKEALQNRKQPYNCSGARAHRAPVRMSGSSRPAVRSRAICPLALRNCGWHPAVTRNPAEERSQATAAGVTSHRPPAACDNRTAISPHNNAPTFLRNNKKGGDTRTNPVSPPFLYASGVLRITASANCRSCRRECSRAARRGCRASSPPMQSSSGDRT